MNARYFVVVALAAGFAGAVACGSFGSSGDGVPDGDASAEGGTGTGGLNQPCYPNFSCNPGLTCAVNGICVTGAAEGGGATDGGGMDAANGSADAGIEGDASVDASPPNCGPSNQIQDKFDAGGCWASNGSLCPITGSCVAGLMCPGNGGTEGALQCGAKTCSGGQVCCLRGGLAVQTGCVATIQGAQTKCVLPSECPNGATVPTPVCVTNSDCDNGFHCTPVLGKDYMGISDSFAGACLPN
jgi:hypothetical protein